MEEIELMLAKSADALSNGNFKDAYFCYLDIIDAAAVELRKVKFIANVAITSASTVSLIAITRTSVTHAQEILSKHNAAIAAISEIPPPVSRKSSLARHQDRIQAGQVKTVTMLTEQLQQQAAAMATSDLSNSPESPFLSRISSFSSNSTASPTTSPPITRTPAIPPKPIRRPPLVHRSSVNNSDTEVLGSSPSATSALASSAMAAAAEIASTTITTVVPATPTTATNPASTPVSTLASTSTSTSTSTITSTITAPAPAPAPVATPSSTTVSRTPPTRPIPPIASPVQPSNTPHQSPVPPSTPQCIAQQTSSSGTDSPPRSKPPLPPKPARLYRKVDEALQAQVEDQTDEDDDTEDDDDDDDDDDDEDIEDPSHLSIYSGSLSRRASSPSIAIPQPRRSGTPLSVPNSPTLSPSSLSSAISSNDRSRSYTLPQFSGPGPTGSFISVIPDGSVDPTNLVEAERISGDDEDQLDHKTYGPSDHIPMIPISPLRTTHRTLVEKEKTWSAKLNETRQQLQLLQDKSKSGEANEEDVITVQDTAQKYSSMLGNVQSTITKVRELLYRSASITSILEFPAYLVAYQLTLIESAIFLEIPPSALLTHSPKTPHRAITASTDFFNYLTRLIEYSVLYPPEASGRAQCIHYWVKLAVKLHELGNFQTLKAVLSALGTPPIKRLKRTWSFLPRKSTHKLETLQDLMSETRNYGKYREMMNSIMGGAMALSPGSVSPVNSLSFNSGGSSTATPKLEILGLNNVTSNFSSFAVRSKEVAARRPMVPFLGTFIMDVTYLLAAVKKGSSSAPPISAQIPSTSSLREKPGSSHAGASTSSPSINTQFAPEDDPRIQDLLMMLSAYQSGPKYSPQPPRPYIKAATKNHHHFRAPSLSSALHRTTKYRTSSVDRQIGSNITHQSSYDEDEDDIAGSGLRPTQQLILHYLLTRPWVPERMVDEVSMIREPSKKNASSSSSSSSGTTSARASGSGIGGGGPGATGSTGSWAGLGSVSGAGGGSLYSSTASTAQRGSTGSGGSSRPTSVDE
ncbi:RasGEF [Actinomortierella ambigua]|nr:RasGEF [Actinomortierella ambigua]